MGSGKTTQGKRIAKMMGYDFLDMDEWISEKEACSVPEIFEKLGEKYFREKETAAIQSMSTLQKVVIATGGGAPCYADNMELLKHSGLTIYLKLSPEALLSRLVNSKTRRPLLANKSEEEMLQTIKNLLEERDSYYSKADMIIDGLERVEERVVNAIQRRLK
jgi:shikimate kinase